MQLGNENKLKHLEGLRGIAALCVFFHHFGLAFYPSYYTADLTTSHLNYYDVKYFYTPWSVLTNGNFMVCVFFVLSGYVLSRKYFTTNNVTILFSAAQRRFLRLFIPVSFTISIAFLLLRFSMYQTGPVGILTGSTWWLQTLYPPNMDPSFTEFLKHICYKVMFLGDGTYDTTVWTMSMELFGSMLVFSSLALTHKNKIRIPALLLLCYVMWLYDHFYYMAFILGILLNYSDILTDKISNKMLLHIFAFIFFVAGILLGSFPSTEKNAGTIFDFMPIWFFHAENIHITGAFLLVAAVVCSTALQKIFSGRIPVFLGKISFSLYLLHPLLICSFSCYLFLQLNGSMGYNHTMLIVFSASLLLLFFVSWLMTKYVDIPGTNFSKRFSDKWKIE